MQLVILDRDGVINKDTGGFICTAAEWQPIPGSIDAIARLSQAGYTVVVATNQSGLGRGHFDLDDLEAMHAKMIELVSAAGGELAAVFYCPHTPGDDCNCRKPKPGLVDAIEAEFNVSAQGAPFVGDSLRDLQAAIAKGCQAILVRTGNGLRTKEQLAQDGAALSAPVQEFSNLSCFVDQFLTTAHSSDSTS